MKNLRSLKNENSGMVAIMVAVFLVLIVSLIVVNYSRLVRREQRQTLDRQLNTQAFYVAESGVDNIAKYIKTHPNFSKTSCDEAADGDLAFESNLIIETGVLEVTCSLVNTDLYQLQYNGVNDSSEVVPLDTGATSMRDITITWRNDGVFNVSGCSPPSLPTTLTNCSPGVLKIDIVNTTPPIDSTNVLVNTFTAYLYPDNAGDNAIPWADAAGPTNQGHIEPVNCNVGFCETTITVPESTKYHMRVQSLYNSSDVLIKVDDLAGAGGSALLLYGAQATIDITAKANDIIRRIKTTVSTSGYGSNDDCSGALCVSTDICKRYNVIPFDIAGPAGNGSVTADGSCFVPAP